MDALIAYAIPIFLVSIGLELALTRRRAPPLYEPRDTAVSLAMGVGAVLVGLPYRVLFLAALAWLYEHRLFTIPMNAAGWVALLFAEDLCYYASHRANHEVRLLWAGHVNHHSSERYHFATALRQSWTQPYLVGIFWAPLPLLGFPPHAILLQQAISLVYQFFIHTQVVGKLGPLEWIFNTPSHHRVHHAVNVRYLDRNHAGIFILWDRLFGTFAEERADDPPVYGLTTNIRTFHLGRVAFHEFSAILRDVRRAPGLANKLRYVLAPPGWSHDGSSRTSAELRAEAALRASSAPKVAADAAPAPPAAA